MGIQVLFSADAVGLTLLSVHTTGSPAQARSGPAMPATGSGDTSNAAMAVSLQPPMDTVCCTSTVPGTDVKDVG